MEKVGSNKLTDRYLKDLGAPPRRPGRRGGLLARSPASLLACCLLASLPTMAHRCRMHAASGHAHAPSTPPPADKEEDELIQMRRAIARLEEEEANLVREMSAALLELGTQVRREKEDIR